MNLSGRSDPPSFPPRDDHPPGYPATVATSPPVTETCVRRTGLQWIGQRLVPGTKIAVMAKKTTVTVTDDLDGSSNAKEVTFSLNGESWTIDLSAKNRTALEKALKPYIAKATKQRRPRRAPASSRSAGRPSRTDLAAVRQWAKSNGHSVSDRGRVSSTVQQAYDAAH